MRAADRWIQTERPRKEHWVFTAGGLPLAHGERSQERALSGVLAWATGRAEMRGLIASGELAARVAAGAGEREPLEAHEGPRVADTEDRGGVAAT